MCVCVWGGGGGGRCKALLQLANFTLGPDATLNTEIHKKFGSHKGSQLSRFIPRHTIVAGYYGFTLDVRPSYFRPSVFRFRMIT